MYLIEDQGGMIYRYKLDRTLHYFDIPCSSCFGFVPLPIPPTLPTARLPVHRRAISNCRRPSSHVRYVTCLSSLFDPVSSLGKPIDKLPIFNRNR